MKQEDINILRDNYPSPELSVQQSLRKDAERYRKLRLIRRDKTMNVNLRGDEANGTHTKFTVFMNGANCGQLCMTEEEAIFFHERFMRSKYEILEDEIISSGRWIKGEEDGL